LSYGPIAVRWDVTSAYLERRVSLLDQNSFFFYDEWDRSGGQRGRRTNI
jgi:hypothetical protein